jgi:hypothetical protein
LLVLIASREMLPELMESASDGEGELLTFTDADALRALEAITNQRPAVVALVSSDTDMVRMPGRRQAHADHPGGAIAPVAIASAASSPQLDQRGTRRAPRFNVAGQVEVLIDGNQATLINISRVGAQVVSAAVLKPNQRLRMALPDEQGDIKFGAIVVWASFENSPTSGPRYRAGIEFINPNAAAVDAYSSRLKAT